MASQLLPFPADEFLSDQATIGPYSVLLYRDCRVQTTVLSLLLFRPVFPSLRELLFHPIGTLSVSSAETVPKYVLQLIFS